jgi:uncharacterized surface protein with fasciclin (FAS1) repeats
MEQSKDSPASGRGGSYLAPSKDIVDAAVSVDDLVRFVAAAKTTGLAATLTGRGPFTVFAPTDEAFKKLAADALDALIKDTAKLRAVLSFHIVKGHLLAMDVKPGDVMTLQGSPLVASVSASGVAVNGVPLQQADLVATNGVIHMIDTVIMPKNWQLLAAA